MNEFNTERSGYRPIPDWPDYIMNADLDVWSLPRQTRCKGGGTRQLPAKRLKLNKGRVSLCRQGVVYRYNVTRELFPATFPEKVEQQHQAERQRPQAICRHGHPLMEFDHEVLRCWTPTKPLLTHWGTGNRICLYCTEAPQSYPDDNTYSLHHGVDGMPDYPRRPLRSKLWNDGPQLRGGNRILFEEVEWGEQGYIVSNSP